LKKTVQILLLITILKFTPSFGDGMFFYDTDYLGNNAESPNQRALIIFNGTRETMIIQVKYSGNVDRFGWVVPIPSLPDAEDITTVSDSIFYNLHQRTQPKVFWGNGAKYGRTIDSYNEVLEESDVEEWHNLSVGPYDISVLSSNNNQSLIDWLSNRGFSFPAEAGPVIDFYIQKKWYFVAVKVDVAAGGDRSKNSSYQAGLPAIKISFNTELPVFPLKISRLTSSSKNEIELYVAAYHRMICTSYATLAMEYKEVEKKLKEQISLFQTSGSSGIACACDRVFTPASDDWELEYEPIFKERVASCSEPTFIVESAIQGYTSFDPLKYPEIGSFDGFFNDYFPTDTCFWITRLRTVLSPDQMNEDVIFTPDPSGDEWLNLEFFFMKSETSPWAAASFLFPMLLAVPVAVSKRLRREFWREFCVAILLSLIIFI